MLVLATDVAFYILAAFIGPLFVALSVWMILRPAEAIRGIYWYSSKPLRRFDLVYARCFGCAMLAFSLYWCGAVVVELVGS